LRLLGLLGVLGVGLLLLFGRLCLAIDRFHTVDDDAIQGAVRKAGLCSDLVIALHNIFNERVWLYLQ